MLICQLIVSAWSVRGQSPTGYSLLVNPEKESIMPDKLVEKVRNSEKYKTLKTRRNSFAWTLTITMLVVYYGYIALIAFNKPFLSQKLGTGVTTIGIPIGMGVIVFTILITGIYVRRANKEFDVLTREILKEAGQ
jgi:uncharacterized membrane protein (DUF485 family)